MKITYYIFIGIVILFIGMALRMLLWGIPLSDIPPLTSLSKPATSTSSSPIISKEAPSPQRSSFIEITDGCGPYYQGTCVNLRSGPGTEFPVLQKLRIGIVFKVAHIITNDKGETWYKIDTSEHVLYPERITSDWYVSSDVATLFSDDGDHLYKKGISATTTKYIIVDLSEQMLYAYDSSDLFMKVPVSTGLKQTPTPKGTFRVYKMTPSRYMQGPVPNVSNQYYDLPGVPWNLYFTNEGAVIHGAYWHDHFGRTWSHGCVNLSPQDAKTLYYWADIGMLVTVQQ